MTLYSMTDKFSYLVGKKRKEATQQEKRQLAKQFLDAKKAECQSWIDNEVFDLVDMRKTRVMGGGVNLTYIFCSRKMGSYREERQFLRR